MKKVMVGLMTALALISGCGEKKSLEQRVHEQVTEKQYALNADERQRALNNAKTFFEKQWVIADNQRGQVNECRPSDSNANGLVTCFGMVPQPGGGYKEVKRFCGYTPTLVGCSDEDTVK